eukprot:684940-Amphidinium_carterae.2
MPRWSANANIASLRWRSCARPLSAGRGEWVGLKREAMELKAMAWADLESRQVEKYIVEEAAKEREVLTLHDDANVRFTQRQPVKPGEAQMIVSLLGNTRVACSQLRCHTCQQTHAHV